jgi:hypothetical protein
MTLGDLRRLSIKKQIKIHYRLRNGLECIVNEHGVALVPELKSVPDFNVEQELEHASDFLVEPAPPAQPRKVSRTEIESMAAAAQGVASAAHDHDDE